MIKFYFTFFIILISLMLSCDRDYSNPIDTTDGLAYPPAPYNLQLTVITNRSISMGFNYNYTNVKGIIVFRNDVVHDTIYSGYSYTDSIGMSPSTLYKYELAGYNRKGLSELSNSAFASTQEIVIPIQFDIKNNYDEPIHYTNVYIEPNNPFSNSDTLSTGDTGIAKTVLLPGTYYITTVKAGFYNFYDTLVIEQNSELVKREYIKDAILPFIPQWIDTTVMIGINDTVKTTSVLNPSVYGNATYECNFNVEDSLSEFIKFSGKDTFTIYAEPDTFYATVRITDTVGDYAQRTQAVIVRKGMPQAVASGDKVVYRGTEANLTGRYSSDSLGVIVEYAWNIDNAGVFTPTADTGDSGKITVLADKIEMPAILRITDDDGLVDYDTMMIYTTSFQFVDTASQFDDRWGLCTYSFQGKMTLLGGRHGGSIYYEGILHSDNGIDWTASENKIPFKTRVWFGGAIHDGKMWVIGGVNQYGSHRDVWYSENGDDWVCATDSAGFGYRKRFASVTFDNKLWVLGGQTSNSNDTNFVNNEVWASSDGVIWEPMASDSLVFGYVYDNAAAVYEGEIWVIGYDDNRHKAWKSSDGIDWEVAQDSLPIAGGWKKMVVYNDRLWVIGSDIWHTSKDLDWTLEVHKEALPQRQSRSVTVFDNRIWLIAGGACRDGRNIFAYP